MTFPMSAGSRQDLATVAASYTITERPLVSWIPETNEKEAFRKF
jgi:hypothetical protein